MNTTRPIAASFCILLASSLFYAAPAFAQGFDRGGSDRGGSDRGRGGSDRGGGDRGGGDRGGSDRGGGDRGGSDRGRGGAPGGFDPKSMLERLDTNRNGVLDPDEQVGPAQFIISRIQQSDKSVVPGKPVPLDKIVKGFEKMREQRDSGGGDDSGRDRGDSDRRRDSSEEAWTAELLVPGFGVDVDPIPLLGFGAASELMSVVISAKDKQDAEERMREFDRDRNGLLSKEELARGRFGGNPLDFDRNRDGQLSASELAVRYARRREVSEVHEAERKREESRNRDRGRKNEVKEVDIYSGRQSYRVTSTSSLPEGTPGFFADKDANGDGQVEMAEFASEWSNDTVAEFFKSDLNRDGIITVEEARTAVELGSQMVSTSETSSSSDTSSSSASTSPAVASSSGAKPDEKLIKYAERIIARYDKNKDEALTASEWSTMLMSPAAADGNRDGRVTVVEYASWMQARSK